MSRKTNLCIYCGSQAMTKDHIPPQGFFIKPYPSNLITVPSCFNCNNSISNDEDYARIIFSSGRQDDGSTKLAETIWNDSVSRSLKRNQKLLRQIIDGFRMVDVYHGPIYLKKQHAISFDRSRIDRVVKKIVKGLFYHTQGRPLNKDFNIKIKYNHDPKKLPEEVLNILQKTVIKAVGGGVIRYRSIFVPDNLDYSAWVISFYNNDNATFFCLTGKE